MFQSQQNVIAGPFFFLRCSCQGTQLGGFWKTVLRHLRVLSRVCQSSRHLACQFFSPHPSTTVAIFTATHLSAMVCYKTGKLADLAQSKMPLDSEEISGYLKINCFTSTRGRKCPFFALECHVILSVCFLNSVSYTNGICQIPSRHLSYLCRHSLWNKWKGLEWEHTRQSSYSRLSLCKAAVNLMGV